MNIRKLTIISFLIMLFSITSCELFSFEEKADNDSSGEVKNCSVLINFKDIDKSLNPDSTISSITNYSISGTGPQNLTFSKNVTSSSSSVRIDNLTTGNWTVTVLALNSKSQTVAQGQATKTLTGGLNEISVSLSELSGKGSFSIDVVASGIDDVVTPYKIQYKVLSGSNVVKTDNVSFTSEKKAKIELGNLQNGLYVISMNLIKDDIVLSGATECIRIMKDVVTTGNISLTYNQSEFAAAGISIVDLTAKPLSLRINQSPLVADSNEITLEAIVETSLTNEEKSSLTYQWYCNGEVLTGKTSNKLTYTVVGNRTYRFDVVVKSNREGSMSSASIISYIP